MEHSFDTDVAQQIGVNCAIILRHLYFWIEKNIANESNFYDGRYWTYSSVKALEDIFPYLTGKQIRSSLKKLVDDGIVVTGNYNRSAYDRTMWYAITEKGFSILHINKIHLPKWENGNSEKGEPIPDNNTDIKTDNINIISTTSSGEAEVQYANVEELPLSDGTSWKCNVKQFNEFCKSYPDVDIEAEFRKMRAWLLSNTKKTRRGITRFVNSWLSRAQDRPRRGNYIPSRPIQASAVVEDEDLIGYQ